LVWRCFSKLLAADFYYLLYKFRQPISVSARVSFIQAMCGAAVCLAYFASATIPAVARGQIVGFSDPVSPGTIVVRTRDRRLYFVLTAGRALVYPVGVGRAGMQWSGRAFVESKRLRPAWAPPPDIKRENPRLPSVIPGGVAANPMGVAALVLNGDDYAIHGTNNPSSIGGFVSHGCIRMYNQDIRDLYDRVSVGTPVIVTR
jgi:lipoprotein-anchoring transpeptidase ErfK/SrfK